MDVHWCSQRRATMLIKLGLILLLAMPSQVFCKQEARLTGATPTPIALESHPVCPEQVAKAELTCSTSFRKAMEFLSGVPECCKKSNYDYCIVREVAKNCTAFANWRNGGRNSSNFRSTLVIAYRNIGVMYEGNPCVSFTPDMKACQISVLWLVVLSVIVLLNVTMLSVFLLLTIRHTVGKIRASRGNGHMQVIPRNSRKHRPRVLLEETSYV